ncbi:hypothetical protein QBC47DRAFT_38920 [Echria macrotheca]|uniref:Uncharacterized protein n=1 Tax=Echria macrotheca TaxID=438768 RepID=A0AAJ0B9F8_9PEZI|nr:hypothetical protein QBC47DRAFT_38920 [Echria macrotheca]
MAATSARAILGSEEPYTAVNLLNQLIADIPGWLERIKELNKSKGEPEAHSGDTTPPGHDNGTEPAEEQAPPVGPADCDKVQVFFQDLLGFVSTSRTMIRRAKRTAKIAQIRRLVELESAEDSECEGQTPGSGLLMALGRPNSRTSQTDDDLDNALGRVQRMCEDVRSMGEHAAHEFLRKCDIDRQLGDIKELADRERVEGDSDQPKQPELDRMRARAYRPPSIRRDLSPRADRGIERGAS